MRYPEFIIRDPVKTQRLLEEKDTVIERLQDRLDEIVRLVPSHRQLEVQSILNMYSLVK